MAVLETRNLVKRYGKVVALDNVSLDVDEGEMLVVIGPSGSGKSTFLRSIAGFVELDSGRVYLEGRDITDLPPEKRDVSMFFQNYALWPHMTVFENVAYGLKLRKLPKDEIRERVMEVLRLLDIEDLAERKPSQLSGGQQQRVALARAIVVKPKVLLLDEPLSNLDAKIRLRIRFEIKALQKRLNIPTVYVTHDQEEALSIADRIAILHNGKLLQVGAPEEVYRNPVDLFVADFLGVNTILEYEVEGETVEVGGKKFNVRGRKLRLVIRSDEVEIFPTSEKVDEEGLVFEGVVDGRLYIGSRYRYEITLEDGKKLFVNFPKKIDIGSSVKVLVKEGSYFYG